MRATRTRTPKATQAPRTALLWRARWSQRTVSLPGRAAPCCPSRRPSCPAQPCLTPSALAHGRRVHPWREVLRRVALKACLMLLHCTYNLQVDDEMPSLRHIGGGAQDVSKSGIAPDELLATATAPVPGTQALAPIDTLRQHRSSSADFSPSADASISGGSDATVLPAMEAQAASSKGGKSTLTSAVAVAKGAMDGVTNAAKGTHAGELTRQVRQLTDTLREQRETLQRQRAGVRRGSLRRALQRWTTRKNRLPFYIKEAQGLLLDVQYGAAARLPVNARAAARRLSGRGGSSADASTSGNDVHAEAPTVLQSIVAPLRPLLQGVHVQPIARVRAAATIGKFRKFWLDHTSVAASLDMGLRHAAALGLPDYGPRAGERSGMHHLAALSLRQQIWGPVRACADVRWDLSTDGGRQGQPHADAKQPGPALGSRPLCHLANLQPERLDGVYGLEFMAGVASLLAWYCPVRKQGMVEIRA